MVINVDELKVKAQKLKQNLDWSFRGSFESFLKDNKLDFERFKEVCSYKVDFALKDFKVTIDLCSVDTHCSKDLEFQGSNFFYHKTMTLLDDDYRHIYIWDYEWQDDRKQQVLKNIILNACGKCLNRVYARNTYVKVVPAISVKSFFDSNNIQGYRTAKDSVGLYDKKTNELLMSYAMGHAYFGKGKYDLEVLRGACRLGFSVIGGSSKLWKYIIETYAPNKSIVYYVDLNYYNGKSLKVLSEQFSGMHYVGSKHSFKNWFVNERRMKNRDPKHHKELVELSKQGLVKTCYNAGSLVYVYNPNESK